jgi:hypothetical protein
MDSSHSPLCARGLLKWTSVQAGLFLSGEPCGGGPRAPRHSGPIPAMRSFRVTLTLALVALAILLSSASALDPVGKEEGPNRRVRSVSGWCIMAWLEGASFRAPLLSSREHEPGPESSVTFTLARG